MPPVARSSVLWHPFSTARSPAPSPRSSLLSSLRPRGHFHRAPQKSRPGSLVLPLRSLPATHQIHRPARFSQCALESTPCAAPVGPASSTSGAASTTICFPALVPTLAGWFPLPAQARSAWPDTSVSFLSSFLQLDFCLFSAPSQLRPSPPYPNINIIRETLLLPSNLRYTALNWRATCQLARSWLPLRLASMFQVLSTQAFLKLFLSTRLCKRQIFGW